jgi:hypothetical protein
VKHRQLVTFQTPIVLEEKGFLLFRQLGRVVSFRREHTSSKGSVYLAGRSRRGIVLGDVMQGYDSVKCSTSCSSTLFKGVRFQGCPGANTKCIAVA